MLIDLFNVNSAIDVRILIQYVIMVYFGILFGNGEPAIPHLGGRLVSNPVGFLRTVLEISLIATRRTALLITSICILALPQELIHQLWIG